MSVALSSTPASAVTRFTSEGAATRQSKTTGEQKLPLLSRVRVARKQAHASNLGFKAIVCLTFALALAVTAVAAQVLSGGLTREFEKVIGFAEFGLLLMGLRYGWGWTMASAYWRFETDPQRLALVAKLRKLSPEASRFVDKVRLQDRPLTVGETRDLLQRYGHLLGDEAMAQLRTGSAG